MRRSRGGARGEARQQPARPAGQALLIGEHGGPMSALAERVRGLGFQAVRAKTPDAALEMIEQPRFSFDAALFSTRLPVADLAGALAAMRARARDAGPTFVAVGPRPSTSERQALRRAGVELGLWEPVGGHALRFQLNRAAHRARSQTLRGEERVPTEWAVRFWVAGRAKQASVYSLSSGGVYLATPRPSQRGCEVALELPLPEGSVQLAGRVVYTNVPGNLAKQALPYGMALQFTAVQPEAQDAIDANVTQRAGELRV